MSMARRAWAVPIFLLGALVSFGGTSFAEDRPKRVLVLYSFGRDYFADFAEGLAAELTRTQPIEIFEVSLETARLSHTAANVPFLEYLHALFAERPPDVIITVAGPAARLCANHRDDLFPEVPLVLSGLVSRVLRGFPPVPHATAVPMDLDFALAVENIFQVAPDTSQIVMVLGGSAISKFWLQETRREFQPFANRAHFSWLHDLTLEEMQERLAALPPNAAILFGEYGDSAGVANAQYHALDSLHAASSAPIFGLFDTQFGHGIVGGPLLSEREASRRAGVVARRILEGEAPDTIDEPPVTAGTPVYDFRELERWGIRESRLPAGSIVLFRPPSLWTEHLGTLAVGVFVILFQASLIGGLLLHRSRRRSAEDEARGLARRLLTANEDERRRLARELHEDLSQRLARLAIDAARLEKGVAADKEPVQALRGDLAKLGDDVHALAYRLHPSVLDDLGLRDALKVECEQFSRRESIRAEVTSFDAPSELPSGISVCLFRIAQEALRNAARHSGASRVSLEVRTERGRIRMTVSDDGVGFDPSHSRSRPSLGLASMRERAGAANGDIEIESAPGRGTKVTVSLPLSGSQLATNVRGRSP